MAEKLESYTWQKPGHKSKYPWDEWLDGSIWRIKRGEDFVAKSSSLQANIHSMARKRGLNMRSHMPDDDTVVFQAYMP